MRRKKISSCLSDTLRSPPRLLISEALKGKDGRGQGGRGGRRGMGGRRVEVREEGEKGEEEGEGRGLEEGNWRNLQALK